MYTLALMNDLFPFITRATCPDTHESRSELCTLSRTLFLPLGFSRPCSLTSLDDTFAQRVDELRFQDMVANGHMPPFNCPENIA